MKTRKSKIQSVNVGNVTVKIYQREKSGGYEVFEVADYSKGFRRLRSFSDPAEAKRTAIEIAQCIANGESEAASIRGKDAAVYGNAIEALRITGVPLLTAVLRYAEAFKILGGDHVIEAAKDFARRNPTKREPRTVRQVADELTLLKAKRGASERYISDLRFRLGRISTAFNVEVSQVRADDVQKWLDGMKASPRSVKNFQGTANTLFKFAESRGYIAKGENPIAATQRIDVRNGEAITVYTPSELHRLLNAAPDWFKPTVALQAFAGLRSQEVLRLEWQDIKLERGHIELGADKTKTATRRLVPITPNLSQWLAQSARKGGKVFPHSRPYFHELQRAVAASAKMELKHNALRHSFISYRVADSGDVPRTALESGNTPAMIFAHYRELVTASDAKAWFAIAPEAPANVLPMAKEVAQ
jgi:integrase